MFTGLITALGVVADISAGAGGARMRIRAPGGWLDGARIGGSIAADGACLTATEIDGDFFAAALSSETLSRCAKWRQGAAVNLEHPLAVGDRLGGHFVSGHIEGTARVASVEKSADGGRRIAFAPPPDLMRFVVVKCSIAVAGVSLTVNAADDCAFAVNVVPHTLAATTLGLLSPGDEANIETDMLARHLEKLVAAK